MSEFAQLTERQIDAVYRHPRDGQGRLIKPRPPAAKTGPATLDETLATARAAAAVWGISAQELQRTERAIRERYGQATPTADERDREP